jgi:hypothetical protein
MKNSHCIFVKLARRFRFGNRLIINWWPRIHFFKD